MPVTDKLDTLKIVWSFADIIRDAYDEWAQERVQENIDAIKALEEAGVATATAVKQLSDGDKSVIPVLETTIGDLWRQSAALLPGTEKEIAIRLLAGGEAWKNADEWGIANKITVNQNLRLISEYAQKVLAKLNA